MTFKELSIKSADFIERIAVILSKRLDRNELAQLLFSELVGSSNASHALVWAEMPEKSKVFSPAFASCQVEKSELFDCNLLPVYDEWLQGSRKTFMLLNKNGEFDGGVWSPYNLLLPIHASDEIAALKAVLSLHYSEEPGAEAKTVLAPPLDELIYNSMLAPVKSKEFGQNQLLASELWSERNMRLILSKIHSRLDKDLVLQQGVDTLGSILKVSSCFVFRNDGQNAGRITHEFVDPSISPLGLGLASSIPKVIAAQMCERTTILEESAIKKHGQQQYLDGMDTLLESSVRSLAGTPILQNGASIGALVIQSNLERSWKRQELGLLESAAAAMSVALRNAGLYQEAKEQVFNLNLLSNLTRQLSLASEQLAKGSLRSEPAEEAQNPPGKLPPLSQRELEVLKLIASGLANREIAQRLFLTESTVELHASRIRKKLKLKSRTALVKFACDNHLV